MTPSHLIVLPAIGQAMTAACLASLDVPHENLVVVDNSGGTMTDLWPRTHVPAGGLNIGVARAWNLGARRVIREGLDWLVICSATMRGPLGPWLDEALSGDVVAPGVWRVGSPVVSESLHGWHLLALHRSAFETVGLFDENLWPAYFEDQDFIIRLWLARLLYLDGGEGYWPKADCPPRRFVDGGMTAAGDAHALGSGVKVNMGACERYIRAKWGVGQLPYGDPDGMRDALRRVYRRPFDIPRNSLRWWPQTTVEELSARYGVPSRVGERVEP